MRVLAWFLVALLAVMSVSLPAYADPADKPDAARLKKEADAFMDAQRFAEAAQSYAKAYDASHDPALLYNAGRALEAVGEYPDAVARLEAFRAAASPALLARAPGLDQHIADLKGRVATLAVTCNVPGAQLVVREKLVATVTTSVEVSVRAGSANVQVIADGYTPFRKEIDLRARTTTKLEVELTPKQAIATLAVRSRPAGCDVFVDGAGFGRTPLETEVVAGRHEVKITGAKLDDEKVEINVKSGERRELDVSLKERSSIASRWWFWTAIGVAVAGAAVATVLVVSANSTTPPATGDFSPGRVSAGLSF